MAVALTDYKPQLTPESAARQGKVVSTWALFAAFMVVVAGLIALAPLAQASGHAMLARVIYGGFSPLCHQIPGRSFHLHDAPFAVCARCTGLYWGIAAGVLAYPLFRSLRSFETPSRGWLLLALVPVGVDFSLGYLGLWANTHWSRAATGGLLGVVIALYLVPGLLDLRCHWRTFFSGRARPRPGATVTETERIAAAPSDYSAPARRIKV